MLERRKGHIVSISSDAGRKVAVLAVFLKFKCILVSRLLIPFSMLFVLNYCSSLIVFKNLLLTEMILI